MSDANLRIGQECLLELVGYGSKETAGMHWGEVVGVRVLVDLSGISRYSPAYRVQPGDIVKVRISNLEGIVRGLLLDRVGSCVHRYVGRQGQVVLTDYALDIRDSVSLPEQGGGFLGVMVHVARGNPLLEEPQQVIVEDATTTEAGRYLLRASLVDKTQRRNPFREVYLAGWDRKKILRDARGEVRCVAYPDQVTVVAAFRGISMDYGFSNILFVDQGRKHIISGGQGTSVSFMDLDSALEKYVADCGHSFMRLVVAVPEVIHAVQVAVERLNLEPIYLMPR
ncbi:MAG: hypothetical protein ABIG95_04090 [Candidatus Woesearchaeota archaeon]